MIAEKLMLCGQCGHDQNHSSVVGPNIVPPVVVCIVCKFTSGKHLVQNYSFSGLQHFGHLAAL